MGHSMLIAMLRLFSLLGVVCVVHSASVMDRVHSRNEALAGQLSSQKARDHNLMMTYQRVKAQALMQEFHKITGSDKCDSVDDLSCPDGFTGEVAYNNDTLEDGEVSVSVSMLECFCGNRTHPHCSCAGAQGTLYKAEFCGQQLTHSNGTGSLSAGDTLTAATLYQNFIEGPFASQRGLSASAIANALNNLGDDWNHGCEGSDLGSSAKNTDNECALDEEDHEFSKWDYNTTMSFLAAVVKELPDWRQATGYIPEGTDCTDCEADFMVNVVNEENGETCGDSTAICSVNVTFKGGWGDVSSSYFKKALLSDASNLGEPNQVSKPSSSRYLQSDDQSTSAITCISDVAQQTSAWEEACGCMMVEAFDAQLAIRNAISQARSKFVVNHNKGFEDLLVMQQAARDPEVMAKMKEEFQSLYDQIKQKQQHARKPPECPNPPCDGHQFKLHFHFDELGLDNGGSDQAGSLYVMDKMPGMALVHKIYYMLKEEVPDFAQQFDQPFKLTLSVNGDEALNPEQLGYPLRELGVHPGVEVAVVQQEHEPDGSGGSAPHLEFHFENLNTGAMDTARSLPITNSQMTGTDLVDSIYSMLQEVPGFAEQFENPFDLTLRVDSGIALTPDQLGQSLQELGIQFDEQGAQTTDVEVVARPQQLSQVVARPQQVANN